MTWSIGAIGMEVSSGRRVTSVWIELAPGGYGVTESRGCLDKWCHPVRVNFWPLQMPLAFSLIRACERGIRRVELVGDHFVLMLIGRGGSWNLMWNVWIDLDIALLADNWHVDRLIFLKFISGAPFRSWRPWWLRSCECGGWYYAFSLTGYLEMWTAFRELKFWIGDDLTHPPPSIN